MPRLALLLIFVPSLAWSAGPTDSDPKLDALINGCIREVRRDRICDSLVTLKEVGDDAIEAVKEYIALGPYEYYFLTVANIAVTGRARFRVPVFQNRWQAVFDFRRDETNLTFTRRF